jgi:uncharacterized protein
MSQQNEEVVRASWEAWLRGDLEGLVADYAADVVWDLTRFREWPERQYVGPEGVQRFLAEWLDLWDAFEAGVDQLLLAPDGRVVSLAWQRGKGRHSGLGMEKKWALIPTLRDGKIVRMDHYDDRTEALEAARVSE